MKILSIFTAPLVAVLMLINVSSCSNQKENSLPQVENEISENKYDIPTTEKKEDIQLTYAVKGTILPDEAEIIKEFNAAPNGYFIEIIDYSSYLSEMDLGGAGDQLPINVYTDESMAAMNIQVAQDFINGKIDIISSDMLGSVKFESFINKGAFADLYSFMEKDSQINTNTLNSHILSLYENNGKLFQLPCFFTIDTLFGEEKYVGNKENWTFEEFVNSWNKMSENALIDGYATKRNVYMIVVKQQIGSFVDFSTGRVSFDSPDFIKLIEFCNSFSDSGKQYVEYDYNAPQFVRHKYINGFNSFHLENYTFDGSEYTFVGYPSENGNGAYISSYGKIYAINSLISKERQQGAWEFIKTFVDEEYQKNNYIEYDEQHNFYGYENGFPINVNAYNEMAAKAINGDFVNENEVEKNEKGTLTKSEFDRLTEYINSVKCRENSVSQPLLSIVDEEVYSYFDGNQSAEKAVSNIQNRITILVSENS